MRNASSQGVRRGAGRQRVGLVLGGGGFVGGAWLVGALQALNDVTDWDPAGADVVLGTSAGSMIGALVSAGVKPETLATYARGAVDVPAVGGTADPGTLAMMTVRFHRAVPSPLPGSLSLALSSLRRPSEYSSLARMAGWLPRGLVSTEPIKETVRSLVPRGWTRRNNVEVVGCDYRTGEARVFSRRDTDADLADAVAASCAIPGFYRPVEIGGHCYIDGGVRSPSNLDLLVGRGLDVVVCLNPTSSRARVAPRGFRDRLAARVRAESASIVDREARALEAAGSRVVVIEPIAADLEVMGTNLMRRDNLRAVIDQARQSVSRTVHQRRYLDRLAA